MAALANTTADGRPRISWCATTGEAPLRWWVDPNGRRFCDEGIAFYDTSTGNVTMRYKMGCTWSIFDESIKRHFVERGVDRGMTQWLLPVHRLSDLDEVLAHLLALDSPGLHVAGNDGGGLHPESYSMRDTLGIASAFALTSGRIAGANAAAFALSGAQGVA